MLKGLLAAALAGEAQQFAGRARRAAILLALTAIAGAIGLGFLIAAAYMLAARRFGGIETAIGFGIVFLAVALASLLANAIAARRARLRRKLERGPELKGLAVATALTALPALIRSRAALPALAIPVVGFLVMRIFEENRRPGAGE